MSPVLADGFSTTEPPGKSLVALLYTNNEISERECKQAILFKMASKKIKYLGINLTKEVKDLYAENYKTLVK